MNVDTNCFINGISGFVQSIPQLDTIPSQMNQHFDQYDPFQQIIRTSHLQIQHKTPWGLQDQPNVVQEQRLRRRRRHDPTPEVEAEDQPPLAERWPQIDRSNSAGTAG